MSKYMEDIQGKVISNPINETNTNYPYIEIEDGVRSGDKYPINSQYMYNHNEPVSDIDTSYYSDYRNKVEELRKKTESTYEALESCLIPTEIPGMSFQPYEFKNTESDSGEVISEKIKSFTYFFQDHLSLIGENAKEFVFRTNKVKFIDDRHRRLIYDRTIHIMSTKEDQNNKVTFKEVILRTFFEYYKNKNYSKVRNNNSALITYDDIVNNILNSKETYIVIDNDGNEKTLESSSDFDYALQSGQDIDTLIPSTLYNLYNIGWINAAVVFLNGLIIEWTKIIISVDNIDTFIIVSNIRESASINLNDDEEITLDYVHIPFKVAYLVGEITQDNIEYKYVDHDRITKQVIFVIDKDRAAVAFTIFKQDFYTASVNYVYDRIICLDDNIKFAEFTIDDNDDENLRKAGINYTKSFKEFCNNDYRCKLKRFNFLGFEIGRYYKNLITERGSFKNDDFDVIWHPFNIMDIRFKRLYNNRRVFKVFYNTKVLYDQDNILRIKNHDRLSEEYEKYRKDVTANIETYINEIYILAKKDIGTYYAGVGKMYGYKYQYVTPYECFLLTNAINTVSGDKILSLDEFKNLNVAKLRRDSSKYKIYFNPSLSINSSDKFVWVIKMDSKHNNYPVVKISEIATGETVLADVRYNYNKNELTIIFTKNDYNSTVIPERKYRVTLYYSDHVILNPELNKVNNQITWLIDDIKDTDLATISVYDADDQIILTDVEISQTSIKIILKGIDSIPSSRYKVAININEIDKHSFINYMNGGFIAIPVDEDSIFSEKIKETDIFTNNILNDNIRQYLLKIISMTDANLPDILVPIDDEFRDDDQTPSNAFLIYQSDSRGKILPFVPIINEFDLYQEYKDTNYDKLKLRFEMCYLNNMEEGSTPIDEFIYYFDNSMFYSDRIPVVKREDFEARETAHVLNAIAKNIFKIDPNLVLNTIFRLNNCADYIIPKILTKDRDQYITSSNEPYNLKDPDAYVYNPRSYYNYGYYDENNIPHRLQSEWGLRRNLSEMFYWSLDSNEYTLDSMHLLDEVFNFTYDFNKTYEDNLRNGLNYIIGYDADKIEQSIKRSIVSFSKTGKELKIIKNNHPCEKLCSLDGYKIMTFIKNKNQKVIFDNIKIIVELPNTSGTSVSVSNVTYIGEDNKVYPFLNQNSYVEMKHRTQTNATILKQKDMYSFKDVDKKFSQLFDQTKTKYNKETELLEFYNASGDLVITTQIDKVIDKARLELSRWNISKQENYVMIFKNNKLYKDYNTIEYTDISFSVDFIDSNIKNTDVFEFVFFLNANNTVIKKICETSDDININVPSVYTSKSSNSIRLDRNGNEMDKGLYNKLSDTIELSNTISCNTNLLDAENVQLLINQMPKNSNDKYNVLDIENTSYPLSYKVKSYKAVTTVRNDSNNDRIFSHTLSDDTKINGLYRVTKQGGREYFLQYDGSVPDDKNKRSINLPYNLYLSSKRQFRYKHFDVEEEQEVGYIYILNKKEYTEDNNKSYICKTENDDFKYCIEKSHLMVFKNELLIPDTCYYLHSVINTPINDTGIVFNVPLKKGDRIDIFYVTNDLKHIETEYYNEDRYIVNGEINKNINDNEYRIMGTRLSTPSVNRTNYIKLQSPLYAISSKHSVFVFLNGKKIRLDELEDISDTIMSITTDYATKDRSFNAVRLEVINHLDTQDIIEQLYINDGLQHDSNIPRNQFSNTDNRNVYKNTLLVKSIDLTKLENYSKRCLLDKMLNDLSDINLNKLFYNYDKATGPMTPFNVIIADDINFANKDTVMQSIIDKYYK